MHYALGVAVIVLIYAVASLCMVALVALLGIVYASVRSGLKMRDTWARIDAERRRQGL